MVVSVDKFTAVKMYDKVQHYWSEEKKALVAERNKAKTKEERDKITAIINYMDSVEMAVIISEDADENEKFAAQGLSVAAHRTKMNEIKDGFDIEDRFKNPNDPLKLVFVCAMWLTGFDVKNAIMEALDLDLPDSYDKEVFVVKTDLLLNHFIDMAVQGYGWVGSVA